MDEAANPTNDLANKEEKKHPIRTTRRKRIQINEGSVSSLWDNFKRSSIRIIGVPEGEVKEQEILFEKIKKTSLIW